MLKKNFWKERQQVYLQIFKESLPILQDKSSLEEKKYTTEDDISRDLSFAIEDVVFSERYKGKELGLPTFQAHAQPLSSDKIKMKREDKCPDFLWTYVDYANKKRLDYYVECKRLRVDITHHCREYVVNGLNRFINKEWSYGINCNSGLMIGYIEGVDIDECLLKIGDYLLNNKIPPLISVHSDPKRGIYYQIHSIDRSEVVFSPFELCHYFVKIG